MDLLQGDGDYKYQLVQIKTRVPGGVRGVLQKVEDARRLARYATAHALQGRTAGDLGRGWSAARRVGGCHGASLRLLRGEPLEGRR